MNAEIISIGTELLMGELTDTNASWIASRLPALGIRLQQVSIIDDDLPKLADAFRRGLERSDVIFTTGGLGPTQDDPDPRSRRRPPSTKPQPSRRTSWENPSPPVVPQPGPGYARPQRQAGPPDTLGAVHHQPQRHRPRLVGRKGRQARHHHARPTRRKPRHVAGRNRRQAEKP